MSGGKELRSSVSFTLPISCQICLGKVKEPVTCSNHHVFCSVCMNAWLDRNNQCPTCRVEITSQSPLRAIIGGNLPNTAETAVSSTIARELRRTRYDLIRKEYEDVIFGLENSVEMHKREINALKVQIAVTPTTSTSPDVINQCEKCSQCSSKKDVDLMLNLTKKLQDATKTFGKTKKELSDVKKINTVIAKENHDLTIENRRIKEEISTRSPMKFGRLTVATLQSRLEAAEKQVTQLQKALQKNDRYTEELENELTALKGKYELATNVEKSTIPTTLCNENPILKSILSTSETGTDLIKQAFQTSLPNTTPSSKFNQLTINTPSSITQDTDDSRQSITTLNVDSDSLMASGDHFESYDYTVDGFTVPVPSPLKNEVESKSSFSRRLQFDENISKEDNTMSSFEFENEFGLDLTMQNAGSEIQQDIVDESIQFSMLSETTLNMMNNSPFSQNIPNVDASPSTGMKTTINAGGARITMSQLSAEERDSFVRPSSAPSRTFLLSGSRFSALRPLDPPCAKSPLSDFQPVKCISPLHMVGSSFQDDEKRVNLSNIENQPSSSKTEEDHKNIYSRVNILKRSTHMKQNNATSPNAPLPSPSQEGRRKQKFSYKRTGEMLFQSPLKSPKL